MLVSETTAMDEQNWIRFVWIARHLERDYLLCAVINDGEMITAEIMPMN